MQEEGRTLDDVIADVPAIVLAAGLGTRLRPLTDHLPKALCPVGNRPLIDHALDRVAGAGGIAVNVHHGRDLMEAHLERRDVYVSIESERPLGTAGAVGNLRGWLDGRAALITNADAWYSGSLERLHEGWDGRRVRLGVVFDPARADFAGLWRFAGSSLLPWRWASTLSAEPGGLYELCWSRAAVEGSLDLVPLEGSFIDCGIPGDYWAANMTWSGGASVIDPTATVHGEVVRSVIWPGAMVGSEERLVEAIRLPDGTTVYPTSSHG
jgi:mannose-1-phosphate guanylyltransferase/MurNAc alpha-1-phosphate uridylyltransferase